MSRPLLVAAICLIGGSAQAQHGLQWGSPAADHRMELALAGLTVGLRVHLMEGSQAPLRLLGDHFLTGPGWSAPGLAGGLRVSGGLALDHGARPQATGRGLALPAPAGTPGAYSAEAARWTVQPYLGIGYSLSTRSGWGFAADLGLGGRRAGDGLRLASPAAGGVVERVLDELRLAPVLQLGVSYAF
ncbi:MAG: hypothetical protein HYZ20_19245 [Burkholderiales bacterium]|nr:hypothetical protein [Burkholderiales bacterium]